MSTVKTLWSPEISTCKIWLKTILLFGVLRSVLNQLLELLVVDVVGSPLGDLVPGQVSSKLHVVCVDAQSPP